MKKFLVWLLAVLSVSGILVGIYSYKNNETPIIFEHYEETCLYGCPNSKKNSKRRLKDVLQAMWKRN